MMDAPKISVIKVAILAGGLGTRLRPIIADRPKVLANVMGRPFLTFLLDQLSNAGIQFVVLCTGYLSKMIRAKIGDRYKNLFIQYSEEQIPLGTGGALRNASPLLDSDPILVMNGDSYVNVDLNAFFEWFNKEDPLGAIVLVKSNTTARYGSLVLNGNGEIITFDEKSRYDCAGYINGGIYLLKRNLLGIIPFEHAYSLEKEFFPALVSKRLCGYICDGEVYDIGTPGSYLQAEKFFSSKFG